MFACGSNVSTLGKLFKPSTGNNNNISSYTSKSTTSFVKCKIPVGRTFNLTGHYFRTLPQKQTQPTVAFAKSYINVPQQKKAYSTSSEQILKLKQVRDRTGAGVMDCKKALVDNEYDVEKAVAELVATARLAQGKTGRATLQGIIAASSNGKRGILSEVSCETDFVAKNELFQSLASVIAQSALTAPANNTADSSSRIEIQIDSLKNQPVTSGEKEVTVSEKISEAIYSIKENITISRIEAIEAKDGCVGSYSHGGRIGSLVSIKYPPSVTVPVADVEKLAHDLAIHVVANNPKVITKPQPIEGTEPLTREDILLEQSYFMDESITVGEAIKNVSSDLSVDAVLYFKRGEDVVFFNK